MSRQRAFTPSDRCKALLGDVWNTETAARAAQGKGNSGLSDKAYELGRTKVYFSNGVLETLEEIRGKLIYMHIGAIQRVFRGTRQRKIFLKLKKACTNIQKQMRRFVYRRRFRVSRSTNRKRMISITAVYSTIHY